MSDSKKVGIAIDSWKLAIFERHLESAGYAFESHPGVAADTLTLIVVTDSVSELRPIVEAANNEAAWGKLR